MLPDPASDPNPSTCQRFTLQQMLQATDHWSLDCMLGSGAFGTVYCGHDPDNPNVLWAVKRAKLLTHDFRREVRYSPTGKKKKEKKKPEAGFLPNKSQAVSLLLKPDRLQRH